MKSNISEYSNVELVIRQRKRMPIILSSTITFDEEQLRCISVPPETSSKIAVA